MTGTNQILGGGGFHHVALRVVDFDTSITFYQKLGFVPVRNWGETPKRAAMLDGGDGTVIEIFEGGSPDVPSEGRIIHFALRAKSCDAAHALALQSGAVETMAPKDVDIPTKPVPYPVRISFVKSPSGELIEFFQER
ncbi:MAG: VOC family protein [Kiritimatiellae bacterium]|nr:VOC family protein [Kiritimatiellia bacterium]